MASYKFALARSLAEVARAEDDLIKITDLAAPFSRHLCEHLIEAPIQAISKTSKFLDSCLQFNQQKISETQLNDATVRLGFVNVIDAFHVVNGEDVPVRFFLDERKANGGIRLTDAAHQLLLGPDALTIDDEVQSRWRLVETAWEMNISRNLISVQHDTVDHSLFVSQGNGRKNITSARGALNGYQKGHCFFCFGKISLSDMELLPDVDHFFPHVLGRHIPASNYDGVWNLTLTCQNCNRGTDGKFAKIPSARILKRLHARNEFLITSHHPLRETLIRQTGRAQSDRVHFLQRQFDQAKIILIHEWEPEQRGPELF